LFPRAHGLVAKLDERYLVINGSGARSVLEGSICREVEASLEAGAPTALLARLAPGHATLAEITAWLATPSVPLTQLDAVRLDGFDTIFVELLGRCNERCVHCYADALPTVTDALDRETALSVIAQARELGFRRIQLTGGDPLLSDYLPEAVRHAREVGFAHVEIYTNGLALTDELLDQLAPHRPAFAFSIYSADPDEHDAITRTAGSHRRTLAAIDRVVAKRLDLRAAIISVDHATDVASLTAMLEARGVQEISWSRTYGVGRGAEHVDASSQLPQELLGRGGTHRATDSEHDGKLCVTYTGDLVPCIFQRKSSLGNVRDGSLLELLSAVPPRAEKLLPVADETARRLQCTSCRLTDVTLAVLRGAR
jgi:MoaA/NifB/PqqE/SkfB family radical SAM enzyme